MPRKEFGGPQWSGVVDGKIYVLLSLGAASPYMEFYQYDPVSQAWTPKTVPPVYHRASGFISMNNMLYSIGGIFYNAQWSNVSSVHSVLRYDPLLDQ
jgi:N-acetylneuraminic acid mutarotase